MSLLYYGVMLGTGAILLTALYFDMKWRRMFNRVKRIEEEEDTTKPVHVPYGEPLYYLVKGIIDLFTGNSFRGESIHKVGMRLLNNDINGSKHLKMSQNQIMGFPFISCWDADVAREVLFTKDDILGKQDFGMELNKRFISESILSVDGQEWKRQKALLSPAFAHEHLKCVLPCIIEITDKLVEKLRPELNKPLLLHSIAQKATLDIIGKSGFGVNFGALDNPSEELENYEELMKEAQNPIHIFPRIDALIGTKKKLDRRMDGFENYMLSLIEKKRKAVEVMGADYKPSDILDLLVLGHDGEDGVLTDRQLVHNVNTFFIAGHETTAGAVTSTIHFLADNPECQQKLYEEIMRICGSSEPTYENLKEMDYLHNCIKETLRLYPPAPVIVRKVKQDFTLNGYFIPKDVSIGVFTYTIHRDPKYWEKPNDFIPERFNNENKNNRHRYGWIPFSIGPRQCIGNNLAFMEMKVMIIRLIQSFVFKPDPLSIKPNVPFMNLVVQTHPKCSLLIEPRA